LRDPFSYHLAADVNTAPNKISLDTSGIRLQGLILARKNGIALQNTQSGAVYFLSEGDEVNGVRVRSITKTGASVNVNGKLMDFPIIEVKK
jgi:hypothetical protein